MTALSGDQLGDERSSLNSVLERADAIMSDGRRDAPHLSGPPLSGIFPLRDDTMRARRMQETWRAFGEEMADAVETALDASRSPPQIAYAIGEILHGYFRTRGVILASYELRRLVGELLADRVSSPLVAFAARPAEAGTSWTGDEAVPPAPAVPDPVFEGPPSPLVERTPDAGAGPLDRLWADRSIDAVFVNGPAAIQVERRGVLEASAERFRDRAHLGDLVRRFAPHPSAPVASFRLRDGGEGVVVFPPAAPDGPVLALRRGMAGEATFDRLIAAAILDRPMAELLRIAACCRLNVLVAGPAGSGRTALLSALVRDVSGTRIVTVARHRAFCWSAPSKVELVVPEDAAFAALLAAATQLGPHLLVLDPVKPGDLPSLAELLSLGGRGIVAAIEPASLAGLPRQKVDLVVSLGWLREGLCGVVAMHDADGAPIFLRENGASRRRKMVPSFAGVVREAGHDAALSSMLSA